MKFSCICMSVLGVGLVFANTPPAEYDLTQFCGSSVSVDSSALLTVGASSWRWWQAGREDCSVQVSANFIRDGDRLRLQLLAQQGLQCTVSFLQVFDEDDPEKALSPRICGDRRLNSTMFLSRDADFLSIQLRHLSEYYDAPLPNLTLLATATSPYYQTGVYSCGNGFSVWPSLECDGYNNCGDWSDEGHELCHPAHHHWWRHWHHRKTAYIIGGAAFGLVVIVIVVVVVLKCRTRNRDQKSQLKKCGLPEYGAIQ